MDIITTILAVLVLLNGALGLIIYSKNRKSPFHIAFGFFALMLACWTLTMIMWRVTDADAQRAALWMNAAYAVALLIGAALWYFAHAFPDDRPLPPLTSFLFFLSTIIHFTAYFSVDQFMVRDIVYDPALGRVVVQNPLGYWIFTLHFSLFYFGGIVLLLRKFVHAEGLLRIQLLYILIGVTLTGAFGVFFNLVLPSPYVQNWQLIWLGPIYTTFTVLSISYAILRHHVLDVKVVAAEFFMTFLTIVLAAHVFFSVSPEDWSIRAGTFVVVMMTGMILVRSVRKEVLQREQLQHMTEELRVANAELARLDQTKSEFLSIASHQLRTPLTAIKGYSSMILDGTYGKMTMKVRGAMGKVYEATERMVALVNDLLDSSRLESGRMKFAFEEVDLGTIAKSVCEELTIKATEKHLKIACSLPKRALPKVWVDTMKIRQVIGNYIDNAVKYSDTGVVEVHLEAREAELIFAVRDRGWGMTPEEMQFLFKKFSRGRGDTSLIKGTGLGLYVCRRLVEAHGGRVWAESEGKGKGSTFFFALRAGWKPSPEGVYLPKEE